MQLTVELLFRLFRELKDSEDTLSEEEGVRYIMLPHSKMESRKELSDML